MPTGLIPCKSPSSPAEAISAFRAFASASRASEAKNTRVISEENERRIVSLFNACCEALRIPMDGDVVKMLMDLEKLRVGMGPKDGLARTVPQDAPGAARDLVKIVYGYIGTKQLGREGGTLLPESLQILAPYCTSPFHKPNLVALGRLLHHAAAPDAPRVMPSSAELFDVAKTMPNKMNKGTAHAAMSTYRSLRELALRDHPHLAAELGPLPDRRHVKGRGLLSVLSKSTSATDRALGEAGDLKAALKQLAPTLFQQASDFVAEGLGMRNRQLSPKYLEEAWSTVGNVAAALYEHRPSLLPTFEISDMWESTVDVSAKLAVNKAHNEKFIPAGMSTLAVPMSRWLVERMAEASREHTGVSGGYPHAVYADFTFLWTMTERLHGNDLRAVNLPLWQKWTIQHQAVCEHMKANPVPKSEIPEKASLRRMNVVSLPHVLCIGAPLLGREAERLLDRLENLEEAATRAGYADVSESESVTAVRDEFETKAECYVALALPWALSLRNAQYEHGHFGAHLQLERGDSGEVTGLRCSYNGDLNDPAKMKQGTTNGRVLGPGILNLRVFEAYLERVRAPRLMRLGVSHEEANAPNGKWPLFVGAQAESQDHCQMSASLYRIDKYGATLYRIATEFLGHDLEPYREMDRATKWRGAWATHDIRKDVATIIGQLMGEWALACALTSDTQDVLIKKYVVDGFVPSGRRGDWRNVQTYLPWTLELLRNPADAPCPLDDPALPLPPLVRQLIEAWADEDRQASKKAAHSKWGVADARLRRPSKLRKSATVGEVALEVEACPVQCQC